MNLEKPPASAPARPAAETAPAGVGLVQKTLQILDLFQPAAPVWAQADIARATGMPRSTVNRLVRFLADRGYLAEVPGQRAHTLGPAAIDLGRRAAAMFDLRAACRDVLEGLARDTGETVILTALNAAGTEVRCVDQIESTHEGLRVFEQIGSVFPLHAGASPKAVLAMMPEAARERYLARDLAGPDGAPVDIAALRADLRDTAARGHAISRGETYPGVVGLAAAFFWGDGRPAGSLAVALPDHRATPQAIARIGALLDTAGRQASAALGTPDRRTNGKEA